MTPREPMPMRPWVDRLLSIGQALCLLIALIACFAWLTRWATRQQADVRAQIGRIESKVNRLTAFVDRIEAERQAATEANRRRIEVIEERVEAEPEP